MNEFDQGQIFYSNQGLQDRNNSRSGVHENIQQVQIRLEEFLSSFKTHRFTFKYRDAIQRAVHDNRLLLSIHLDDLQLFDSDLASLLREAPDTYIPLFEEAAANVAAKLENIVQDNAPNDPLENQKVGPIGDFQLIFSSSEKPQKVRQLHSRLVSKLVTVSGIVTAASILHKRVKSLSIECRNCKHQDTIEVKDGFGGAPVPRYCARPNRDPAEEPCPADAYVIRSMNSKFVNFQTLKLQELPEEVPTGEMPRSILLSTDRYLTDIAQPGVRIAVMGVFSVFQSASTASKIWKKPASDRGPGSMANIRTPYVRVLGIDVETSGFSGGRSMYHVLDVEEDEMLKISRIPNLYETISQSIAPEVIGSEDIKKAISCLLFGGSKKVLEDRSRLRGDINVLLLGDPSTAKSQLLKFSEKVAPISVYTSGKGSSAAGLTASVVKDNSSKDFHLEGGAMVFADGGIVCIDEFDKMRLQDRVAIHEAMEQQTISIAKAGITAVLNARASVLAAANPAFGRYDDTRMASENIEFQSTILSRFDLIFIVRDVRNESRDRTIASHVIQLHQQGSGKTNELTWNMSRGMDKGISGDDGSDSVGSALDGKGRIKMEFLKRYIAYAKSHCFPRLSDQAREKLLENYIQIRESNRVQASTEGDGAQVPITVRQLEAIIRLAESLAKMSLCSEATEEHVMEALRLFRVATLDAGSNHRRIDEGQLGAEFRQEIERAKRLVKARLSIGSSAPEGRLIYEIRSSGVSEDAAREAIYFMLRTRELEYRQQRKRVYRIA